MNIKGHFETITRHMFYIHRQRVAVACHGMDQPFVRAAFAQDLLLFDAVLVGKLQIGRAHV